MVAPAEMGVPFGTSRLLYSYHKCARALTRPSSITQVRASRNKTYLIVIFSVRIQLGSNTPSNPVNVLQVGPGLGL